MTADESDTVEMEDLPGESDRTEMVFCLCNVSMISVCVCVHAHVIEHEHEHVIEHQQPCH